MHNHSQNPSRRAAPGPKPRRRSQKIVEGGPPERWPERGSRGRPTPRPRPRAAGMGRPRSGKAGGAQVRAPVEAAAAPGRARAPSARRGGPPPRPRGSAPAAGRPQRARSLGGVLGVMVHATALAPSGSPTPGRAPTTAGPWTSLQSGPDSKPESGVLHAVEYGIALDPRHAGPFAAAGDPSPGGRTAGGRLTAGGRRRRWAGCWCC